MTDIKELRRLAESPVLQQVEWVSREWALEHFGSSCEAEFVSTFNPSAILSLLDKIDAQEKEIAWLHTSIAGAVQHGEQGWQRYEAANKMCLNQQKEIARLNEVIAELRKDAEQAYSILTKSKTKVEDLDVHEEITAFIKSHTSTQEVG